MPHYRLYFMDPDGAIASVDEFSARDDVEAIRITRDCRCSPRFELWCRERIVGARDGGENASDGLMAADGAIQQFINRIST
jgi:hypothetical protein